MIEKQKFIIILKVLSFDVFWDDQSVEGQVNYFTLNFFLADDTVEVKEVRK